MLMHIKKIGAAESINVLDIGRLNGLSYHEVILDNEYLKGLLV